METRLITYAIPVFFLLIGIELLYSILRRKRLYRLHDSITDLSTGVGNQIAGLFFRSFTILAYIYLYENFRIFDFGFETPLKAGMAWVSAFLLYDFCYYWMHRMSHEWNLLWAGHVVHHSSEEYNLTVALRQPAFHGLFTWIFYLPLAVAGIDPAFFVVHGQINLIYQFWIHTRAVPKLGILEWFLNTPSHHRVHHGRNPRYIDKNHGGTLIIWDRLFGTFQEEDEEPAYGTVKPLRSWNPVWANIHHFADLFHFVWHAKSWKDRFQVWFRPPGWRPESMKDYKFLTERMDKTGKAALYDRFDTRTPSLLSQYGLIWFILATSATFLVLLKAGSLATSVVSAVSILVVWSLLNVGGLLELKKWAWYSELLRLVTLGCLTWMLALTSLWLSFAIIMVLLLSFTVLFVHRQAFGTDAAIILSS
jgi:sterol desaturase/sphingolipid hydroxylase (fatty acid hydroxylase superfamily)